MGCTPCLGLFLFVLTFLSSGFLLFLFSYYTGVCFFEASCVGCTPRAWDAHLVRGMHTPYRILHYFLRQIGLAGQKLRYRSAIWLITKIIMRYLSLPVLVTAGTCDCRYLSLPVLVTAGTCYCQYLLLPVLVTAATCCCRYLLLPVLVTAGTCGCRYLLLPVPVAAGTC